MARRLIDAGADVNAVDDSSAGDPALKVAVAEHGLDMIRLLLDAGANPYIPGWMQATAVDKARSRQDPLGPKILVMLDEHLRG